jgi:hypothetical protein
LRWLNKELGYDKCKGAIRFIIALKDWIPACTGMTTKEKSCFHMSVIPVKTGIQNVADATHYSILQLAIEVNIK